MIRFGINSLSEIKNANLDGFFTKKKQVSLDLYEEVCKLPNSEPWAERILLLFSDERGAYKRTYQKRFEAFDEIALNWMRSLFNQKRPLRVQDVGVSDGRTAVDFFEKIEASYPAVEYHASDYSPEVQVLEKGRLKLILSPDGRLLQISFSPFVFNQTKMERFIFYPLNHFFRFLIKKIGVEPLLEAHRAGLMPSRNIRLFAPRVLAKAESDTRFHLERQDILNPFPRTVEVVRAMNILNSSYFSQAEFKQVIGNIYTALNEGGIFIMGSNQGPGSPVHGAIYQKQSGCFTKLYEAGKGSIIDKLIVGSKDHVL